MYLSKSCISFGEECVIMSHNRSFLYSFFMIYNCLVNIVYQHHSNLLTKIEPRKNCQSKYFFYYIWQLYSGKLFWLLIVWQISNYGLHAFTHGETQEEMGEYEKYKKLLWTAPEFLENSAQLPRNGTPKGDTYSYGIILQEIVYRTMPFFLEDMSPKGNAIPPLITKCCRQIILVDQDQFI